MTAYVSMAGLTRVPRWTPQQAVLFALGEVSRPDQWYQNKCDMFCSYSYGYMGSGYTSAAQHWNSIPSGLKHYNAAAPPGAFVFWNAGYYGHIALCVAPGYVASNDIRRIGKIDVVPISTITNSWGALHGWTPPYVQAAWGFNPNVPPSLPTQTPTGGGVDDVDANDVAQIADAVMSAKARYMVHEPGTGKLIGPVQALEQILLQLKDLQADVEILKAK